MNVFWKIKINSKSEEGKVKRMDCYYSQDAWWPNNKENRNPHKN